MAKVLVRSLDKDFEASSTKCREILNFSYLHFYEIYRIAFFQNTELKYDTGAIFQEYLVQFKDFVRRFDRSH